MSVQTISENQRVCILAVLSLNAQSRSVVGAHQDLKMISYTWDRESPETQRKQSSTMLIHRPSPMYTPTDRQIDQFIR